MITYIERRHKNFAYRILSAFIALTFSFTSVIPPSYAQTIGALNLPVPGAMVPLSAAFVPVLLKGMTIHPENPLQFDFIVDSGNTDFKEDQIKEESQRLVKYFLASMTIPKDDLWVNLSPYESDKIVPDELGKTELGRDMLAQDYILKQLTASLMYPEKELGKEFWNKVYKLAQEKYGTTEIPVNTFNKVWILPETATVYEHGQTVYIVEAKLKVMLDSDYLAQSHQVTRSQGHQKAVTGDMLRRSAKASVGVPTDIEDGASGVTGDRVTTEIVKEIILPAIEREVNEGQNFAPLRQIYHSLILAKWYKETIKNSLLSKIYIDQKKIAGVNTDDPTLKDQIYAQYMEAYKKGVFNYIKEDYDRLSNETIPRKYFSGGEKFTNFELIMLDKTSNPEEVVTARVGKQFSLTTRANPQKEGSSSPIFPLTISGARKVLDNRGEYKYGKVIKAIKMIGDQGKRAGGDIDRLKAMLADYNEEVRGTAEKYLTHLQKVEGYIKALFSIDYLVRISAIKNLKDLDNRKAIEPLKEIMRTDGRVEVRILAIEAIISIGDEEAPLIQDRLKKLRKEIEKIENKKESNQIYVYNLLPRALDLAMEGYDFELDYQEEIGDMESSREIIDEEEYNRFNYAEFGHGIEGTAIIETWVVTTPEEIKITRGEKFDQSSPSTSPGAGPSDTPQSGSPVSETEYKAGDKSGTVLELTSRSLMEMIESMIEQQVRVGVANPFEGPNVRVTYHKGPHLGGFVVQENPGRAPGERKAKAEASHDAGNGNPGIPHCFLCYLNIPKNEMAIRYKDGFLIYPNPAPFEKNHIVIAEQESEADRHPIQLLQTRKQVEVAVDLIEEVAVKNNRPGYNISFNSFGAADTSSHFHFQGFETNQFFILKKEIFLIRKNGVNIGFVDDPNVDAIVVEGIDKSKVIDEVLRIAQNFNKTFRSHFQELSAIGDESSFKSDLSKRMGNPKTRDQEVIPYNVLFKAQQKNGQALFRVYFYPRLWETPQSADSGDAELLDTKFAVAELSGMYITHLHDRVNMITKEIMEKNLRLASFHNREDLINRILGFNEGETQHLTEATEKKMSESFFVSSGLLASTEELLRFFENDENKLRAEMDKWINEYKEKMGVLVSDSQILDGEFLRLTDEHGRYDGGIMPRDLAHAQKQWHRTVGAFVIDRQGNVLFQKRSDDKAIKPGAYDVSVGGHAGLDDPQMAVAREIEEEIFDGKYSIDPSRLFPLTADNEFVKNEEGKENASFFVYVLEEGEKEKVKKQDEELDALEWLGAEALDNLLRGYKGYAQDSDDPYAAGFLFFENETRKEALLDLARRLRGGESIQEASSPIVLARDIESAEELIVQQNYEKALKKYKKAQTAVGTLSKKEVKKDDEAAEKKGEKIIRYLRELKEDIDERITGLELAIAFEKNELTEERIQGLSSYQMVALLRILPMAEFSIPQKFILYSGAPGSGKGTLMEQTFDKKARFGDIVGQLLLYHTRPARKGELDGKKYHFRLISVLKTLEQIGRIKRTAVNKQQQGVADEEFVEDVVVHPNVLSEALLRGDIVIKQGDKDLSEKEQWVVEDKQMAVKEETVVKRKIKGVKEAFGTDKITVMEGGYGWFLVLTKDPRYADIFTVFITPFEDDEIALRGKNQEIISATFARPFDRFIAYSLMNIMRLERGKEKLDLQDPETLGELRGKVDQWLQTWGARESSPEMMRSLKRHETDEKPALKNNAVLIESDEFIEQINRSLKKYFGKEDTDLIKTDQQKALARALAYEVQMKLAGDVARGDTSFYLEIPTEQSEETGIFTRPEDMFNRVVEGVIQIMSRKDYYAGARAGKGLVVRNKFVYDKDKIKEEIAKMAGDFSTAYFAYLLTAMVKEKGERDKSSTLVGVSDQNAASDQVGGIDMNSIGLGRQGTGVDIQFDPVELQEIIDAGIDGFAPVIINITPLPSVLPLLGLDPVNKEEELEVSVL